MRPACLTGLRMTDEAKDPPPEARKLPTGRIARTARVGGLVTSQGARWAGMRTANRVRSPERAAAAQNERTAALVNQLVDQLGQMRGAAMKVGQVLSMVEFDGLPEDARDALQARLAELRDDVPPVPFPKLERLMRDEFGGPLSRVFSEFDERAFAAASIGQVHRATTLDGDDVVVKVQYPGVAEAVETDLRNAMLLLPLVKRLAPGLDVKALASELRERIAEELDYELEAQNQRRIGRLRRGHPFISVPCGQHRALDAPGARVRVHRGRAVRGGSPARRAPARQLWRDRLPLLLRPAVPRRDRAWRPASRELPPAPDRTRRLPRLRAAARCQRRARWPPSGGSPMLSVPAMRRR